MASVLVDSIVTFPSSAVHMFSMRLGQLREHEHERGAQHSERVGGRDLDLRQVAGPHPLEQIGEAA